MTPEATSVSYKVVANTDLPLTPKPNETHRKGETVVENISPGAMIEALVKGTYSVQRGSTWHVLRIPEQVRIVAIITTLFVKEVELTPDKV